MEFDELEVFTAIAKLKSFSAAARALYLSQATISTKVKSLEQNVGMMLFRRNNTTAVLTEAGEVLIPYANQLLALKKEAKTHMSDYKLGLKGKLTLAASHTICNWVLPSLIKKFRRNNPDIEITLFTSFTNDTIEKVLSGEVQFGLIRMPFAHFLDDRFNSKLLEVDKTLFFTHPNHSIFCAKDIKLERISKEQLIVYGATTSYWPQMRNVFEMQGLIPNAVMELNDTHAVKLFTQLGSYVAFLPEVTLKEELTQGTLKTIDISDYVTLKRYSFLIYRKDRSLVGIAKEFWDFANELSILEW